MCPFALYFKGKALLLLLSPAKCYYKLHVCLSRQMKSPVRIQKESNERASTKWHQRLVNLHLTIWNEPGCDSNRNVTNPLVYLKFTFLQTTTTAPFKPQSLRSNAERKRTQQATITGVH